MILEKCRLKIGLFKEKYIKLMLIKNKRKAIKGLDLLENVIYENGLQVINIGLIIIFLDAVFSLGEKHI